MDEIGKWSDGQRLKPKEEFNATTTVNESQVHKVVVVFRVPNMMGYESNCNGRKVPQGLLWARYRYLNSDAANFRL